MKEIILASASERRSRILSECGIKHRVLPSGAEEFIDKDKDISEIVQLNALAKANKAVKEFSGSDAIVIGADTLVIHDKRIIGKPADEDGAREMLRKFSGSKVMAYTGLCVIDVPTDKKAVGFEKSEFFPITLSEDRIERYFKLMAPYDKAGGFSIEGVGSLLFDDIKGSYFNILGLPMIKLAELFEEAGEDIIQYIR